MQDQHIYTQIRKKIGQGNLEQALRDMKQLLENSPKLDEAIHQSRRFKDIRKQIHLGTASHEDMTLTENQITSWLLDLLREMETGESAPHIQEAANEPQVIQQAEKIYNIQHIDQANFN